MSKINSDSFKNFRYPNLKSFKIHMFGNLSSQSLYNAISIFVTTDIIFSLFQKIIITHVNFVVNFKCHLKKLNTDGK